MSDLFDDFNKIFKKDLLPIFVKYLKDPKSKITDNFNDLLNDPKVLLNDIVEKFLKNKDNDINRGNYADVENIADINLSASDEYDDLIGRLIIIEENIMQIENLLKDKF